MRNRGCDRRSTRGRLVQLPVVNQRNGFHVFTFSRLVSSSLRSSRIASFNEKSMGSRIRTNNILLATMIACSPDNGTSFTTLSLSWSTLANAREMIVRAERGNDKRSCRRYRFSLYVWRNVTIKLNVPLLFQLSLFLSTRWIWKYSRTNRSLAPWSTSFRTKPSKSSRFRIILQFSYAFSEFPVDSFVSRFLKRSSYPWNLFITKWNSCLSDHWRSSCIFLFVRVPMYIRRRALVNVLLQRTILILKKADIC